MSDARPAGTRLAATLLACLAVLCTATLVIDALTDGLEHWSFEDVRRNKAQRGRLAATSLEVRTASNTRRTLWRPLAAPHRVMLVDFVYTTCPTVCQALGTEFTRLQGAVSAPDSRVAGSIELVSLSFDVEKDTSARLAGYARRHRADDNVWTIAAPLSDDGSERTLRQLGIVVIADGNGGYVHNGSIHAMTPDGRVLAVFDEGEWQEALAFATRLVDASP